MPRDELVKGKFSATNENTGKDIFSELRALPDEEFGNILREFNKPLDIRHCFGRNPRECLYKNTQLIVCWHCQSEIAIQDLKDTVIMELKKLWGKI